MFGFLVVQCSVMFKIIGSRIMFGYLVFKGKLWVPCGKGDAGSSEKSIII